MSLIRGTKSKSPCPICLAKNDELVDLTKTWPLRTTAYAQEVIQQARGFRRVKDREALLSKHGLRNVDVSTTPVSCFIPSINSHRPIERILELVAYGPISRTVLR